jgi:4-hydroxy-3-methylbut-2-en-1-yl diphosphate synthase IspG/GcpE
MKHNLLYVSCPICGKQLIDLALLGEGRHEYWCDHCLIDIVITESEEGE